MPIAIKESLPNVSFESLEYKNSIDEYKSLCIKNIKLRNHQPERENALIQLKMGKIEKVFKKAVQEAFEVGIQWEKDKHDKG